MNECELMATAVEAYRAFFKGFGLTVGPNEREPHSLLLEDPGQQVSFTVAPKLVAEAYNPEIGFIRRGTYSEEMLLAPNGPTDFFVEYRVGDNINDVAVTVMRKMGFVSHLVSRPSPCVWLNSDSRMSVVSCISLLWEEALRSMPALREPVTDTRLIVAAFFKKDPVTGQTFAKVLKGQFLAEDQPYPSLRFTRTLLSADRKKSVAEIMADGLRRIENV